jgi:hypothetical protein
MNDLKFDLSNYTAQTYFDNQKKYYEPIVNKRIGDGYTIEYIHDVVLDRGHSLSDETVKNIGDSLRRLERDSSTNKKILVFSSLGTYYGFRSILEDRGYDVKKNSTIQPSQFKIREFSINELSEFKFDSDVLIRSEGLGAKFDCSELGYSGKFTEEERLESDVLGYGKVEGSMRFFGVGLEDWVKRYEEMKEDTPEEQELKFKAKIVLEFIIYEFTYIHAKDKTTVTNKNGNLMFAVEDVRH